MSFSVKSVLVVDDSEADQCMARYAFEDFDDSIEINKAYDGQEALQSLAQEASNVDLILLDINMPRMNAYDFLEQFDPGALERVPFIIVQSSTILENEKKLLKNHPHVHYFMDKPLTLAKLEGIFDELGIAKN